MRRANSLLWVTVLLASVTAGLAMLGSPAPATADERADEALVPGSDPAALVLIGRAERASYTLAYTGVQYLAVWCPTGETTAIADISHVPGVGTTVSAHGTAAGQPASTSFAASVPAHRRSNAEGLLARNFRLILVGAAEVAGRPADVVEARRPAGDTVAARLWLDRETGFVLRKEIFNPAGAVVRASAFLWIRLTEPLLGDQPPAQLPQASWEQPPVGALEELVGAGWTIPTTLSDGLRLFDVQRLEDQSGVIVHLSYSDGLSTVSLFMQRGRLAAGRLADFRQARFGESTVYRHDGIPRRVVWAADGIVYTIFADAPEEMIESAVAVLPRGAADTGVIDRLGRGLARVGSWLNPFG